MNFKQMQTLLPLIEAVAADLPPALVNLPIEEGEPVLNGITPFSVRGKPGRRRTWVLDQRGTVVHSYDQRP